MFNNNTPFTMPVVPANGGGYGTGGMFDDCVGLFFNFTNNDNENRAAAYVYQVQVFQDGIELDFSLFHLNDESKDSENEIQKGITLKVCEGFVLRSDTPTAHVVVKPWISFNDKPLMEFDIEIPQ